MRVLVISAHPDDETLGCGGTLLRHRGAGDEVNWAIATRAHTPRWTGHVLRRKESEILQVAGRYGARRTLRWDFPAAGLDAVPIDELIRAAAETLARVRPHVVYVVHQGDVHTDHQAVHTAVTCALKPPHMKKWGVRRLLSYETLSSTEAAPPSAARAFLPTVYRDISAHLDEKLRIMGLYRTERQPGLWPRGISALRALARWRGAAVGVAYAEAFALIRELG